MIRSRALAGPGVYWSGLVVIAICFVLSAGASICAQSVGSGKVEITTVNNLSGGKAIPVTAAQGTQFVVKLDSNRTTGFQWQLAGDPDPKIVKLVNHVYNEPINPKLGTGGSESWTFQAVGKGTTSVVLNYLRTWEKGIKPAITQTFSITVQ